MIWADADKPLVAHPVGMTERKRLLSIVCSIALMVAACSGAEDSATATDSSAGESSSNESTTSETSESAEGSETTVVAETSGTTAVSEDAPAVAATELSPAVTSALDLTLGWMNGQALDEASYQTLFTQYFQDAVPYEQFVTITEQLAGQGPWSLGEVVFSSDVDAVVLVSNDAGVEAELFIEVEDGESVVINDLLLTPASNAPEVATVQEALVALESQGTVRFLAADVGAGDCAPVEEMNADEQMPLGSIFKLYVLQAVVDAVGSGELTWDQPVVIRDELDSLPSGTTQDVEAGTEMSVRELADLMISISDNTATDHLIDLVGREVVEQVVADSGHPDPELNVPFMTTRELFILKFTASEDERADYLAASVEEKRATLAEMANWDLPSLASLALVSEPIEIETLEWFASPTDVCHLLLGLVEDDAAREVLALSPGVPDIEGRWSYLGYKGGSEWGVLAMAWIGTTVNGDDYVVVGGVANTEALIEDATAIELFGAARDLIADGS